MARGRKSELPVLNLNQSDFAAGIESGDIVVVPLDITVDKQKDAEGKTIKGSQQKVTVQALHARTDAGVAMLLSDSGHFIRAANRYVDGFYAAAARKANLPFERQFADSIASLMARKNISRAEAIERLKAVLG
jgi:hypothetical protein